MNFKEWLSENDVKTNHGLDTTYEKLENIIGKEFWICDYRVNDVDNKPIRNVFPKLVRVFSNDELSKNKNVYYSPIHFREVKGKKVLSAIIAPYDNTGYRAYTGVSLNIFNTQKECRECFERQCNQAISQYKKAIEEKTNMYCERINEIKELIKKCGDIN